MCLSRGPVGSHEEAEDELELAVRCWLEIPSSTRSCEERSDLGVRSGLAGRHDKAVPELLAQEGDLSLTGGGFTWHLNAKDLQLLANVLERVCEPSGDRAGRVRVPYRVRRPEQAKNKPGNKTISSACTIMPRGGI